MKIKEHNGNKRITTKKDCVFWMQSLLGWIDHNALEFTFSEQMYGPVCDNLLTSNRSQDDLVPGKKRLQKMRFFRPNIYRFLFGNEAITHFTESTIFHSLHTGFNHHFWKAISIDKSIDTRVCFQFNQLPENLLYLPHLPDCF